MPMRHTTGNPSKDFMGRQRETNLSLWSMLKMINPKEKNTEKKRIREASKSEENKKSGNNLRLPKATIKNNKRENIHQKVN